MLKFAKSKVLLLIAILALGAFIVGGCGQTADKDQNDKGDSKEQGLSGSITIAGSTSVQPFSDVLAEEFMAQHPEVQINVQGGGSSQGVAAAVSGAADIGAASRELKEDEKSQGLNVTRIALDGVAVIVNPANEKISDLTMEQVRNIYLGNITNWQELGGDNAPITVVCREEGSGTRDAFESIIMDKEKISNKVIIQNSNGAVRTAVAGDKNSIGFVSLAIVNDEVKAVKIEGIEPTVENIKNNTYKVYRPFNYLTKGEPDELVKAFIEYVLSDEGQKIMVEEGAISVK